MATGNPMQNFNRRNPFVIQAKQAYSGLMDQFRTIVKLDIIFALVQLIPIIIAAVICQVFTQDWYKFAAFAVIILIAAVVMIRFVIDTTVGDPINKNIDQIVKMEMNEVESINLEQVNDMIHNIHYLLGVVNQTKKIMIRLSIWTPIIYSILYVIMLL